VDLRLRGDDVLVAHVGPDQPELVSLAAATLSPFSQTSARLARVPHPARLAADLQNHWPPRCCSPALAPTPICSTG